MAELPLAPVRRILRDAGAKRASVEAVEAFAEALEEHARDVTAYAARLAKNSRRTTVQGRDIRAARVARS